MYIFGSRLLITIQNRSLFVNYRGLHVYMQIFGSRSKTREPFANAQCRRHGSRRDRSRRRRRPPVVPLPCFSRSPPSRSTRSPRAPMPASAQAALRIPDRGRRRQVQASLCLAVAGCPELKRAFAADRPARIWKLGVCLCDSEAWEWKRNHMLRAPSSPS